MAGSLLDKAMRVGQEGTLTSLQSPGKALAASSITIGSGANWESTTGFIIAIRTVDSTGVEVANTYTEWIATYSGSGTTVTINPVPVTGSDQVYTAGTNTQVFLPVSAKRENLLIDAFLAQHSNPNGAHQGITTDTVTASGNITAASFTVSGANTNGGWTVGLAAPTSVTALGNRSYSMLWNGNDYSTTLSAGMRGRTTRTVAAGTQVASLNGTTQYFSKTSPAGFSNTNFPVGYAFVKLAGYPAGDMSVGSKYNGTSGIDFKITSSGQVQLTGFSGGSANFNAVVSYQAVPLNKWVMIAAQLDMSTATLDSTHSYIMIDGVNVPASKTSGGTNPTSFIQAGNLEVGSRNGGLNPFNGKIAQFAFFSAAVPQATHLAAMNQTLAGTETSLISAYSFNNTINDLNTTNANNLTANGSATATAADSPFGGQADGTISSTLDYHIYQKVSVSGGNTTAIVQVPEGCTIPTTGGVSAVAYSQVKAPYGMPVQRGKWGIEAISKLFAQQTPTANTWYNLNSLKVNVPIGEWSESYSGYFIGQCTTASTSNFAVCYTSLSPSSSSESDSTFTDKITGNNCTTFESTITNQRPLSVSAATDYFLIEKTDAASTSNIILRGDIIPTIIRLENAYL